MSDFARVILVAAFMLSGISIIILATSLTAFSGEAMRRGDAEGNALFAERAERAEKTQEREPAHEK